MVILDGGRTLQEGNAPAGAAEPRNARVADLVGIRNHFEGVFHRTAKRAGTTCSGAARWNCGCATRGASPTVRQ